MRSELPTTSDRTGTHRRDFGFGRAPPWRNPISKPSSIGLILHLWRQSCAGFRRSDDLVCTEHLHPDVVVMIASIRSQDSAQMRLAQDDEMVHTLAPDRADQPFGKAILPRRGWRSRFVPDAHGAQSACDEGAVYPIPIANEVLRGIIPRKCLGYLTGNPFCCRQTRSLRSSRTMTKA